MKTEKSVPERCEIIQKVQRVLGGSGKLKSCTILVSRIYTDLERCAAISAAYQNQSLINQLRSLEEDGFISRHDYKELPPRVEYSLTDLGQSFMPIMEHMKDWGETHLLPLSSSR